MLEEDIDLRTVNKAIKLMQRYISEKEFQETLIYHTTHLARLSNLYDRLYAAMHYDKAHKVLQDHRECYIYLTALMSLNGLENLLFFLVHVFLKITFKELSRDSYFRYRPSIHTKCRNE